MDYFQKKRFSRWDDAKKYVQSLGNRWVYRGQSNCAHDLKTSLERLDDIEYRPQAEERLLSHFQRRARAYLAPQFIPAERGDEVGWFSLMQHYGAPTRFQDWTRSPYVGFFFAFEQRNEPPCDRALWAVNSRWMQLQATDLLTRHRPKLPRKLTDVCGNQRGIVHRFFLSNPDCGVLPVEPWIYDTRQAAQQAVFLCPANVERSFVENLLVMHPKDTADSVVKIVLSADMRGEALRDLSAMNVTAASLFPGLDGFGRSLRTMRFDQNLPQEQNRAGRRKRQPTKRTKN